MQARITWGKGDFTKLQSRNAVGVEIDAREVHLLGDGFGDTNLSHRDSMVGALDRGFAIRDRNVRPVWHVECRSQVGEAVNINLDQANLTVEA